MLRHMAAELKRKDAKTTILAMHPGEVLTYVPHPQGCAIQYHPHDPQKQLHHQHDSKELTRTSNTVT